MSRPKEPCPIPPDEVIARYFLEHRAKLIDIAAFLDRVERAGGDCNDFRIKAMHEAIVRRPPPYQASASKMTARWRSMASPARGARFHSTLLPLST